jgi:hypothetical protein
VVILWLQISQKTKKTLCQFRPEKGAFLIKGNLASIWLFC